MAPAILVAMGHVWVNGLLMADLAVIAFAMVSAHLAGHWLGPGAFWPKAVWLAAVLLFALYRANFYQIGLRISRLDLVGRLFLALGGAATATMAISFAFPTLRLGRYAFIHIFVVVALGLLASRLTCIQRGVFHAE